MPSLEDLVVDALANLRAARETRSETSIAVAQDVLDSRLDKLGRR